MRRAASLLALAAALASRGGPALAADPARGERLFVGEARLANGGAPCLACHALAGHGLAWSASLGPDLSSAAATYDEASLGGVLADVPFPTMEPIYRVHALAPEERADLAAFLLGPQPQASSGDPRVRLAAEAIAGSLVLLGAFWLLDRRRMPPAKDALRARAGGGSR